MEIFFRSTHATEIKFKFSSQEWKKNFFSPFTKIKNKKKRWKPNEMMHGARKNIVFYTRELLINTEFFFYKLKAESL